MDAQTERGILHNARLREVGRFWLAMDGGWPAVHIGHVRVIFIM